MSVAGLHPPVEVGNVHGLVMNAAPSGLVMVDGVWREYQMIGGHMAVQPLTGGGASVGSTLRCRRRSSRWSGTW